MIPILALFYEFCEERWHDANKRHCMDRNISNSPKGDGGLFSESIGFPTRAKTHSVNYDDL